MAGQTAFIAVEALVDGHPLIAEFEEYTAPEIKKVMESAQGGMYMDREIEVGLEKMTFELKISGLPLAARHSYGLKVGTQSQIDIIYQNRDDEGTIYKTKDALTCNITGVKDDPVKMKSKASCTISGACIAFKRTENGSIVYDIDIRTNYYDLGQGNILA